MPAQKRKRGRPPIKNKDIGTSSVTSGASYENRGRGAPRGRGRGRGQRGRPPRSRLDDGDSDSENDEQLAPSLKRRKIVNSDEDQANEYSNSDEAEAIVPG